MSDMALTNVRPGEVEAYLAGRQWNHHSTVESGSVWTAEDDPDLDVFVPHHRDFADYERRLHDLVRILSAVEKAARRCGDRGSHNRGSRCDQVRS
jgi:hypothetical protein